MNWATAIKNITSWTAWILGKDAASSTEISADMPLYTILTPNTKLLWGSCQNYYVVYIKACSSWWYFGCIFRVVGVCSHISEESTASIFMVT